MPRSWPNRSPSWEANRARPCPRLSAMQTAAWRSRPTCAWPWGTEQPPRSGTPRGTNWSWREEHAMPRNEWSGKRERQYEHIKAGLRQRGESEDTAEEIAARTVNKERARRGESKSASRLSVTDISSGRRGGLRSHRGSGGRTRDQLYEEARRRGIRGRSKMSKAQLERAVGR